ncbi:MAG: GerAB/ArcD/ProY family transporter [Clostridia bacterium]|nr:GerAB/ArcD/ProY family transporter [Clostridia bacterium]
MKKLTARQAFCLYVLFILGSISTIGGTNEAGRDYDLSFLAGGAAGFLFNILYIKIGNNGRIFRIISTFATVYIAAIAMSLFTMFISQMTLIATPNIIIAAFIAATVYIICRGGIVTQGRLASVIFPIVFLLITIASLASLQQSDFESLLPLLQNGIKPLLDGSFTSFMFYFAEGFSGVIAISMSAEKKDAKRGILWGTVFVTLFVAMIFIRNLAVLGWPFVGSLYFPSYTVASLVRLGDFFQRMEVLISIVFILCKLMKIALLEEYVKITLSEITKREISYGAVTAIVFTLSQMIFGGVTDAFIWLENYRYYLIFPCVIMPALVWLRGKIKRQI